MSRTISDEDEVQLPRRGLGEVVVTMGDIRSVIRQGGFSPDELYGASFMKTWREDENAIEKIMSKVDHDRAQEGTAAAPPAASPAEVKAGGKAEKPEPAEKELSPYLNPAINKMIKLD
jgi:ribosomal protein L12E/L44/L45/RPP1/RPP2